MGNVTDMRGMFAYVSSFNQSLHRWNVSNVTNMRYIFNNARSLTSRLIVGMSVMLIV